jgi:hypothetical protein
MSVLAKSHRIVHRFLILAIFSALLLSACCPAVTSFTPNSGGEGTEVTIKGKRFGSTPDQNRVKIGGITVPIALVTHASSDTLKVHIPADAKSGPISVDNMQCSGESDEDFAMQGAGARPDLVPKALYFDSNRVLHVGLANEGAVSVPSGIGEIFIFADGRLLSRIALSSLADQSFRSPGGRIDFSSDLRIGGSYRRIMVVVDPQDDITESNEVQNTLSLTLTPPAIIGPDLAVRDLQLGTGNTLRIGVQNLGTASTPPNMPVRLQITRNGIQVVDTTQTVPALAPGPLVFVPVPAVTVNTRARIEVAALPQTSSNDIDITNNYRAETLPGGPSLQAYRTLLAIPKIRNNILWHGFQPNGQFSEKTYDQWSTAQKTDLEQAILLLEREGRHALTLPPVLVNGSSFSLQDAWKIYLAHVAHCLWTEVNGIVPWHLVDFRDDDLKLLLDSRTLMVVHNTTPNTYSFYSQLMGNITAWNPLISYQFLSNLEMIKPTQTATIFAVTDWMRAHLIHISGGTDYSDQYGYAGPPPADRVLYPLEGKRHITAGCWGTTGLYAALLRSVNIPVKSRKIQLIGGTHSNPGFPTAGLALVHGDDPYTMLLDMSGNIIPSTNLFYSLTELSDRFIDPPIDCVDSQCNPVGVQAGYNQEKDQWQLTHDYLADYPLYIYARDGAAALDSRLEGPDPNLAGYEYVKPLFQPGERQTIIDDVATKLMEIGDGDVTAGGAIVIERWQRFHDNK